MSAPSSTEEAPFSRGLPHVSASDVPDLTSLPVAAPWVLQTKPSPTVAFYMTCLKLKSEVKKPSEGVLECGDWIEDAHELEWTERNETKGSIVV